MKTAPLDLAFMAADLFHDFPTIKSLYLFGSRRFRTGSTRSDIDTLVEVNGNLKPSALRDWAIEHYPALDPFIVTGSEARSCINDSYLKANSFSDLVTDLKAIKIWTRENGRVSADVDWEQEVAVGVRFEPTVLPNIHVVEHARRQLFEEADSHGLPTQPYLGEDFGEVADFLGKVVEHVVQPADWLGAKGQGRSGWTVALKDEYDFQNLFWTVVKPWLPDLEREQVAIEYDGQKKNSDFSLSKNKIIIELKHIVDASTKAAVVKTMEGLAGFYKQHPNVRAILFLILVENDVDIDVGLWEKSYSYRSAIPRVITKIVRNCNISCASRL